MARRGHRLETIGQALILLGIVNFIAHALGFVIIGGSALQGGKIENSRYYVSWYGSYNEVSRAAWHFSRIHMISNFVTFPLVFVGVGLAALGEKRAKADSDARSD